jgi:hypothetical protein
MNRIAVALAATLLTSTAWPEEPGEPAAGTEAKPACTCGHEGQKTTMHATKGHASKHALEGKPTAPVTIRADLDAAAGTARVTVQFDAAASDVEIAVRGLDGLVISSPAAPLTAAAVPAGEVRTLDVSFTPGEGRSLLAVAVTGRFGGARRAGVTTFAMGEPTASQKARPGKTLTDAQGRRIKALPADTK